VIPAFCNNLYLAGDADAKIIFGAIT